MKLKIVTIVLATALSGCATKHYGRTGAVTQTERDTMTCRELELEIERTRGWLDRVNKESEFSGADVLAILGDFGIGNAMEKSAALKSGNDRLQQLQGAKASKCSSPPAA